MRIILFTSLFLAPMAQKAYSGELDFSELYRGSWNCSTVISESFYLNKNTWDSDLGLSKQIERISFGDNFAGSRKIVLTIVSSIAYGQRSYSYEIVVFAISEGSFGQSYLLSSTLRNFPDTRSIISNMNDFPWERGDFRQVVPGFTGYARFSFSPYGYSHPVTFYWGEPDSEHHNILTCAREIE